MAASADLRIHLAEVVHHTDLVEAHHIALVAVAHRIALEVEVRRTVLAEAHRTALVEEGLHIVREEELRTGLEEVHHTGLEAVADAAPEEARRNLAGEQAIHIGLEAVVDTGPEEVRHNLAGEQATHTGLEVELRTDLAGAHRIVLLVAAADPNLAVVDSHPAGEDTVDSALAFDCSPAVGVVVRILEAGLLEGISRTLSCQALAEQATGRRMHDHQAVKERANDLRPGYGGC